MKTTFSLIALFVLFLLAFNTSFAQEMKKSKGEDKNKMEHSDDNRMKLMDEKSSSQMKDDKMMKEESDVKVIDLVQHPGIFDKKELTLPPGKYKFRIKNADVNKVVGFYIHKPGEKEALKNSLPDGHINKGETKTTGVVEIKEGEYEYSYPLNPTPEYKLIVK